jgi:hypothetical protein
VPQHRVASDDDRASAMMFYYSYLAATAGIRAIDVDKISENIAKVTKQCEAQRWSIEHLTPRSAATASVT